MNTNRAQSGHGYTNTPTMEDECLDAIRESYAEYNKHGARSQKKLHPLHQWVADVMKDLLGAEYDIQSFRKGGDGHEKTISGKYYKKTVDVSISKDGIDLGIISIKFITANFKQNANNYFENLMGETANLRRKSIIFGHFMVIPNKIPYLKRDKSIKHYEELSTKHLRKYVLLGQDDNHPHRPDALGIAVISLPLDTLEDVSKIEWQDVESMSVDGDVKNALSAQFSITSFMHKMKQLIEKQSC